MGEKKFAYIGLKRARKTFVAYGFDENFNPTRDIEKMKFYDKEPYELHKTLEDKSSWNNIFSTTDDSVEHYLFQFPLPRKTISKKTRELVFSKYNGHCAYCGCEITQKEMQVDHFIPHTNHGGEDTLDNFMPSCALCNRVKSSLTIEEFKEDIRHRGAIHRKRKKKIMADSDKIAITYGLAEQDKEIKFYFEIERKE